MLAARQAASVLSTVPRGTPRCPVPRDQDQDATQEAAGRTTNDRSQPHDVRRIPSDAMSPHVVPNTSDIHRRTPAPVDERHRTVAVRARTATRHSVQACSHGHLGTCIEAGIGGPDPGFPPTAETAYLWKATHAGPVSTGWARQLWTPYGTLHTPDLAFRACPPTERTRCGSNPSDVDVPGRPPTADVPADPACEQPRALTIFAAPVTAIRRVCLGGRDS
jgi:hypothetical protein